MPYYFEKKFGEPMDLALSKIYTAVKNREHGKLMRGISEYEFPNPYADTPTDTSALLSAIERYEKESGDSEIWQGIYTALIGMCDEPDYVWLVLYYLRGLKDRATKLSHEDLENLLNRYVAGMRRFKDVLKANHKWMGADLPNGLWDDALRLLRLSCKKHGWPCVDINA